MDLFLRTGTPQVDPANEARPGDIPAFLTPVEQQPEVAPYDWTIAGAPLPEELRPLGDMITGLNSSLASLTGVALDDVDLIMRNLGTSGFLDKPGDGKQAVIDQFEKLGIAADKRKALNQFLADIGEGAGQNLLMLSAFMAAAPSMMAAQGPGMLANFQRQFGTALVRNPGTAISAEVGAAAGAETGERLGGALGHETMGGVAGALVGGSLPSAAGKLLGMTGIPSLIGGVRQGMREVRDIVNTGRQALGTEALLTDAVPNVKLVSQAIQGDQMRVDRIIENMTTKLTQNADPIESARALQTVQRNAYRQVRAVEDGYWQKVDLKRKLSTQGLKTWGQNLVKTTVQEGRDEWLPNDLLEDIRKLPANASMERLRAIRTKAFHRLQSGTVPSPTGVLPLNDKLRGSLNALTDEIDNQIGRAFPNDVELQKAASFTKWLHDRFTRGPVGRFAQPRSTEAQLPNVDTAAGTALRDDRFGPYTQDISRTLRENNADMPALEVAAEQFLRGQLNEEVTRLGPQAAAKFLKQPGTKQFLKAYPKLAAEWEATTRRLDGMMTYRKEVLNSAFVRTMNEQPETAIRSLLTSRNRVRDARSMMQRIGKDTDALDAAKNQMILSLEDLAGGNPQKILTMLQSNDTRRAAKLVLGDDLDRLERIARDASSLMQTDKGIPRFIVRKGARVMGSWLGRKLNTGTLQAPEFGGRLAEQLTNNWLGRVETDIFSKAVRYPAWEAVLRAKVPQTIDDTRHLKNLIRRAIRVEEAAERATAPTFEQFIEDDDDTE